MKAELNAGDNVIFDSRHIEQFVSETSTSEELLQYQRIILAGIDQVGAVKEFGENLTTVTFPDGWEIQCQRNISIRKPL
jgi:hypothetical protein